MGLKPSLMALTTFKEIKPENSGNIDKFENIDAEIAIIGCLLWDNNNYEQVSLESSVVGEAVNYLTENMMIEVSFFKGRSIGLSLPNFVVLEVIETAPGEKGNTVTGASKPAVVATGYSVNVPLFVNEGDQLRVDTRTGEYVERVKG